jgi:predicted extracellular nuclease
VRSSAARTALALAGAAGIAVALATVGGDATAVPSTTLVISEAYGGGGNSGAPLKNDFIEVQNVGSVDANLDGYSVQYISASPTATTTWSVTPLSGTAPKSGHFLVGEAAGTNTTAADLPTPDNTGTLNLSGTAGTVALVHSTAALTCKTAVDCAGDTSIVDLVGYGSATIRENTAAPATTNATSAQRAASGADTDNNAADFTSAAPSPTAAGIPSGGDTDPGPLRIHDIQSSSWVSPQNGSTVTNVPGIVTALRKTSSKGFWIQDPNPDDKPATSEGIFVFTSSNPTVAVGDSVLVTGKVSDYYPLSSGETLSATSNLSITEIGSPTVKLLSSGNPVPAPLVIGPDTVPDLYAPDLGGGNIESTPIAPARSALDYYESIEGMRVEVDDARVVGPSNQYGEQYVTTKPASAATYRGGAELLGENKTPAGRLEVATLDGSALGLDVGDVLQGATVGPIDWSNFGGYVLEAAAVGTVQHNHLAPVAAKEGTKKQLSIATYNVENLAPSDAASKYQALAQGVVTNLATPDIVALEEIQDNTGGTDNGVVAADQTLTKLTAAIKAAGGPSYEWREIDPVDGKDGGQPGGNIRVAFLFNPTRVSFVDAGPADVNRSTTGTQVTVVHKRAALSLSPGRIDPTNPVWNNSRKPLAGNFSFNHKNVIVIANHFDSKGGDQNADGRYQYPEESSQVQRAGQAQVVHDFVNKILATDKTAQVVVVGDLNDYQFSTPLAALKTGTADGSGPSILTDLITTLPLNQQYTYVYNGVSQVLDHILVSPRVSGVTYQVVHVNSEYSAQVSDHDPQVVDITP